MKHTELQSYFKERVIELFHKNTLDSYRVRSHNAFSLLKELKELIIGWKRNRIKQFETVQLCIQETKDSISQDECLDFSFYSKNLFLLDLEEYAKSGEKDLLRSNKILFTIEKAITHNADKYLPNLLHSIEEVIFNEEEFNKEQFIPTIQTLDNNITALCCELIHRGYSKIYLYGLATKLSKGGDSFRNRFENLKEKFTNPISKKYIVIFRLHIPERTSLGQDFPELSQEISSDYLNENIEQKFKAFIKPNTSTRFYIHKCKAVDPISAIKTTKAELASLLDILHLGMSSLNVEIPNTALVLIKQRNNTYASERNTQFLLDGNYSNDLSLSAHFKENIAQINKNALISQDVKDRLDSALRHLRIGNTNVELEQRFINYWIALEFIFSSSETNENTYTRLKTHLINILTCCYAKRNLLVLNESLIQKRRIDSGTFYWEKDDIDDFINNESSLLLKFRLLKMKSRLFTEYRDKKKTFIENHEKNLSRHIARIYRMRNELIHEAAIKQDIENVTSNLRYYLVFLLNQMIVYFSNIEPCSKPVGLEDYFYEYEMWKKRIKENWDFNTLMAVPIEMDLLK